MPYNPAKHHRRSIRLPGYDYAGAGAYFITICVQNRECLFGDIVRGKMNLNDGGQMAERCWSDIPRHFPHVVLDEFVIMPNHVHGVIQIIEPVAVAGAENFPPLQLDERTPFQSPSRTVGSIVRGFKIGVTKWFRANTGIHTVWQRNYHERVIRNPNAMNRIREYIRNNPMKWYRDRNNQPV